MKIFILYFSGTGNTYFVASKIMKTLQISGYDVSILPIEKIQVNAEKLETTQYDAIIIGFPVYALSMPFFIRETFNDLITKLSLSQRTLAKEVFLFETHAFHAGSAMRKAAKFFKEKGLKVIGYGSVKLPGSDGLLMLKKDSRFVKKIENQDFNSNKEIVRLLKNIISSLENHPLTDRIPSLYPWNLIAELFIRPFYAIIERIIKRKFYADSSCTHCHICEQICPSKNITVTENEVMFDNRCYLCLRCIHQCPEEAIQISKITSGKYRYHGPSRDYNPLKIQRKSSL